jgi:carbon-monoxide dehydrogenase medium subunit
MLPSAFEYHRPSTLDEALALLSQHGEDAKVLAGGQSLIPLMKLRFAAPEHLVDVNRITGLDGIEERDDALHIGALVRHNHLAASEVIARYPRSPRPRRRSPIRRAEPRHDRRVPSHADPAGDLGSVMLALGASVVLRSAGGERTVPIGEFLVDTFQTSIGPGEMLTEIVVPTPRRARRTYLKMERKVGDFATVGAAVFVQMHNGTIGSAGIGLTSVGLKNLKATAAEAALSGADPGEDAFAEAGRLAAEASQPATDVRGSEAYKRHVVDVYVRRGLARAVELARA